MKLDSELNHQILSALNEDYITAKFSYHHITEASMNSAGKAIFHGRCGIQWERSTRVPTSIKMSTSLAVSTVRQVQRSQDKEKAKLCSASNISSVEVLQKYPLLY